MTAQLIGSKQDHLSAPSTPVAWVIVDSNIDDLPALMGLLAPHQTVFVLPPDQDGVEHITRLLAAAPVAPQALHLIAHGAPGLLHLGNTHLSLDTLPHYAQALAQWAVNDLYLYGCNIAAGDAGAEFLQKVRAIAQVNIAAATHSVGHQSLGGHWELDTVLGQPPAATLVTPALVENYRGTFNAVSYVVIEDNENNALTGQPDGDFGTDIRVGFDGATDVSDPNNEIDLGPIQPIEFNIFTDVPATIGSAVLFLSIFDIDLPRERNLLTFNGIELGILEGGNDLTFKSVFRLNPALINLGKNLVQIDINIDQDPARWEAEIEKAELLINYVIGDPGPGATAFLDQAMTNQTAYEPGETIQFTADIDTSLSTQDIEVQAILRDPSGRAVSFDTRPIGQREITITGLSDGDVFTWSPVLPNNATTGIWSIDISVFDEVTDTFQFLSTQSFSVGCGTPAGPSVFQFQEFVRFEELDNPRPYLGNQATSLANFRENVYRLANPDIDQAILNGQLSSGAQHFFLFGLNEGRARLPLNIEMGGLQLASLFDETYYLFEHPDVAAAVESGLFLYGFEHFVAHGIGEGRNPSYYYDEDYYLQNNSDVLAAVGPGGFTSGLQHYILFGHKENRSPSTLFDAQDYLTQNEDVRLAVEAGAFDSGFDHYISLGANEGRINTLLYEESFYLSRNSDVADAVARGELLSGFDHYVSAGQKERRDPGPLFDESAYLGCYPDVAAAVEGGAFSSGMEHYFRFGRQEGRFAFRVEDMMMPAM